jgi:manganese transport protein
MEPSRHGGMSEATLHEAKIPPSGMTARAVQAGQEALSGKRRGLSAFLPFAGPAVIASVAYMDPGNFATNIQAGAKYGYALLWVVLGANMMAMLFQALSAKLGIATGMSLAEASRKHFPRSVVWTMWGLSEVAAMATDLAEFLGAGIGLSLLLGIPLLVALGITAVGTYAILTLQHRGFRPMEIVISGFVGVIGLAYIAELLFAPPDWGQAVRGTLVPTLADGGAVMLAVGIIGATVMPHAIYLHSALTKDRIPAADDAAKRRVLHWSNREVLVALGIAGLINMAMVCMAARVFHPGHPEIAEIETAYHTLMPLLGAGAASVFMISLLASGFSSSVVGTLAGQGIMQDFIAFRIPLWLRRAITMAPSFVVVALGYNATDSLIASQVVLSLVLPVPMIALLLLTRRRDVMGSFVNTRLTQAGAILAAIVVLALNTLLLLDAAGVKLG